MARDLALGIDIGGTFTDLCLLDRASGQQFVGKVLTDVDDLARGVMRGVGQVLAQSEVDPAAIRAAVHGTTLATNALIERRGAHIALLVTQGFPDVLEFARESRYDIYDIDIDLPRPLVPRARVFEVSERLDAAGAVVHPLDEAAVVALAHRLEVDGIVAVAVCYLHAYLNPDHERRTAELLAEHAPGLAVSLSSAVAPDIREFERANTTAANAYIQPPVRAYLGRLRGELCQAGIAAGLHMMTSDGGTISAETAARFPVRIVESGPAGGARAAAFFGRATGVDDVIAFDMGGTTAKIAVIEGGKPERSDAFEFGRIWRFAKGSGLPLKVPSFELIEIGAGGGSIAAMDETGLLKVGPRSAGSSPGPACYGLGGTAPTVTDADLYLGYLDPGFFLGGRMKLDRALAVQAIERDVARPLAMSATRAAWGICELVNDAMAQAAKVHCLERGKDPRRYTLVAYGGAGPVHAYRVAQALGIGRILLPPHAGVLSAFGFMTAAPSFEFVQACPGPLPGIAPSRVDDLCRTLEADGRALLRTAGVPDAAMAVRREAAVRYAGQSFELNVQIAPGALDAAALAAIAKRFLAAYRARYHRLNPDAGLEMVRCRVTVSGPEPRIPAMRPAADVAGNPLKGHRPVFFADAGEFVRCPVYDRASLLPGFRFDGPAIVEEAESTAVVGPGGLGEVLGNGALLITVSTATPRAPGRLDGDVMARSQCEPE